MSNFDNNFPSNWQHTNLKKIAKKTFNGGTPSTTFKSYWNGNIPWITSKWLNNNLYIKSGEKFISAEGLNKSSTKIVPAGNLIFATRVGVGKVSINTIDIAINQDLTGIIIDNSRVDSVFITYQLRSSRVQQFVEQNKRGATIKGVTRECVKEIELFLPSLEEQRKIAWVLSLVQDAIAQQEQLITLTTELKKTLMHKLFTEGTRGEPQKKTEIDFIPESWDLVKLKDAAESFQYGTSIKCDYDKDGKPVLRIPNVIGGYIDISDLKYGQPKPNEIRSLKLQDGDLLFVRTNGTKENSGRCSMYRGELGDDCYFASYLIQVRLDKDKLLPAFLDEYTRTDIGTSFLSGQAIRTADGKFNINSGTLQRMLVPQPSLDEQREIADIFSNIDTKISNYSLIKEQFKDLFRTLLHQLMTAKIRVDDLNLSALNLEAQGGNK